MAHKDKYSCFADLRKHEDAGAFKIVAQERDSDVLILAPHGGAIEPGTSQIAREIARDDFCLYLFEGKREHCNYDTLHVTSTRFDEPRCLRMLNRARVVLAVHGCSETGREVVYLGGRNHALRDQVAAALEAADYEAPTDGHRFPGSDPRNICNLSKGDGGVQLELSKALRNVMDVAAFSEVVRSTIQAGM